MYSNTISLNSKIYFGKKYSFQFKIMYFGLLLILLVTSNNLKEIKNKSFKIYFLNVSNMLGIIILGGENDFF